MWQSNNKKLVCGSRSFACRVTLCVCEIPSAGSECVAHRLALWQEVCSFALESGSAVLLFLPTPRSSLTLLFSSYRNLLARKQNARLDKQNDLGWKLFGKLPLRENAQKDSKKIQKVYKIKNAEICYIAYIYEPCKNDCYWGFETGKLCVNLHAKFLKFKSVFRMSMTNIFHFL